MNRDSSYVRLRPKLFYDRSCIRGRNDQSPASQCATAHDIEGESREGGGMNSREKLANGA